MENGRDDILDWVACEVLPHEGRVRAWLGRALVDPSDVDDVIQEAYCRLSELGSVAHIRHGGAYFFTTARSIVLQRLRRERTVSIEVAREPQMIEEFHADDPSPERVVGARRELERVLRLIDELPQHYQRVIELRRIQGLSQKETARILGVTENVVENHSVRGLRMILRALSRSGTTGAPEDVAPDREFDVRTRIGARN